MIGVLNKMEDIDITGSIKIGNYDVNKDDVWLYIQHFGRDKTDLWSWEKQRKVFHDNIFFKLGIDRFSDEGRKFSDEFDKFCEPHIMKYDGVSASMKQLSRAKTDEDIEIAQTRVQIETRRNELHTKLGFRQFKVNDVNICRICNKELEGGRVNDHLARVDGFDEINQPICMDCSKDNPDEYHIAFKEQYWSK